MPSEGSNFAQCKWGDPNCYCEIGFPYEKMCPECRDGRDERDVYSYCVCPK